MKTWIIVGVVLNLALLGGCTRAEKTEAERQTQGLGAKVENAAESARQTVSDAALAAKVKTALSTRKGQEGTDIQVETKGTVVTLKGDVNTRAQAEQAEEVARGTTGVTSVVNQLMLRVPVRGSAPASQPGKNTGM